jgi:hypothetical protein
MRVSVVHDIAISEEHPSRPVCTMHSQRVQAETVLCPLEVTFL